MIILVDLVVPVTLLSHDDEVLRSLLDGSFVMKQLIKVVMNNLTDVDHAILMELNFSLKIELDPGSVNEAQVTNVVLTI